MPSSYLEPDALATLSFAFRADCDGAPAALFMALQVVFQGLLSEAVTAGSSGERPTQNVRVWSDRVTPQVCCAGAYGYSAMATPSLDISPSVSLSVSSIGARLA